MSASQLILIVLIVAAFALGWWGRGRRTPPAAPHDDPDPDSLDQTLGYTLTAFQAALSLWQAQAERYPASGALATQSIAAFTRRRAVLAATSLPADAPPKARVAYDQAQRAADRLADGLAAFKDGSALDLKRERALISAERALSTARLELRAPGSNGSAAASSS